MLTYSCIQYKLQHGTRGQRGPQDCTVPPTYAKLREMNTGILSPDIYSTNFLYIGTAVQSWSSFNPGHRVAAHIKHNFTSQHLNKFRNDTINWCNYIWFKKIKTRRGGATLLIQWCNCKYFIACIVVLPPHHLTKKLMTMSSIIYIHIYIYMFILHFGTILRQVNVCTLTGTAKVWVN